MNDYKELLEILRNIGKYGTINNALVSPTMLAAADAIEQLVKERDALLDANDSAHKDRREAESKAAKAELEVVCLKEKLADTVDTVKVVHKPTKAEFKRMAAQLGYEPVRHAHWEPIQVQPYFRKHYHNLDVCCSACHTRGDARKKFCSECGAKMDEKNTEDDKEEDDG